MGQHIFDKTGKVACARKYMRVFDNNLEYIANQPDRNV